MMDMTGDSGMLHQHAHPAAAFQNFALDVRVIAQHIGYRGAVDPQLLATANKFAEGAETLPVFQYGVQIDILFLRRGRLKHQQCQRRQNHGHFDTIRECIIDQPDHRQHQRGGSDDVTFDIPAFGYIPENAAQEAGDAAHRVSSIPAIL
jgi:hypothetical protein